MNGKFSRVGTPDARKRACPVWEGLGGIPLLRGYPETLSLHRRKLMQHPCGNEIQGDRTEQVGSA
jgi:hypothetical protein